MIFDRNIKLNTLGSFKIGGEALFFKEAKNVEDITDSLKIAAREKIPFFILGGGTNILWKDEGFDGLVLKPNINLLKSTELEVTVGSGVMISDMLEFVTSKCLSGLEWAGGLPGTLGGAIRGNAGAFGGEIKDTIKEVVSLDTRTLEIIRRTNKECEFDYRNSVFKKGVSREVIIQAKFILNRGNKKSIRDSIEEKINYRLTYHPMEHPNIGSVFKNVDVSKYKLDLDKFSNVIKQDPFPVIPTAFLISEVRLKGISCGGAMISPKHPNFIVNVLNASSNDVKSLINLVKAEVLKKFKVSLEEEVLVF